MDCDAWDDSESPDDGSWLFACEPPCQVCLPPAPDYRCACPDEVIS